VSPAVKFVRGGEILEVRDGNNNVVSGGVNASSYSYSNGDDDDADANADPFKEAKR
jgi:hypothetical protein